MKTDTTSSRPAVLSGPDGDSLRELAYRETDGLVVALLWDDRSDRLAVTVDDTRTGERFTVPAARDRALDVFQHPFAYAASPHAPRTSRLLAV